MVEKDIAGGMCHSIYRYAKAKNKYMKDEWIEDTSQFNEDFIKKLYGRKWTYVNFILIYHFYQKRMKIEKVEKLVADLHDKTEYVKHIRNLKQALNHGLVLKKVDRVIQFKIKMLG